VIDDNPRSQTHNGWHCCDLQPQVPRSRAFYYSRNSLLHTWIPYYTELPMKVPITLHRLENPFKAPPPIAITGNRLTLLGSPRLPCGRRAKSSVEESSQSIRKKKRVSSAIERERTRLLDGHRGRHAWRLWVSGPSNGR